MLERIRFQKTVSRDLEEILHAYEILSVVTANKVRAELSGTFDLIALFPEMYAVIDGDIRLVKTKTFPLLIQYRISNGVPVVLSIYHSDLGESRR